MQNRQLLFRPENLTIWSPSEARRLPLACNFLFGGVEGDRTPDLSHAMGTLYQLSYNPK